MQDPYSANTERNVNVIMLHCCKDISSLYIYRFGSVLKEILGVFVEIEKVDFKIYMEMQRAENSQYHNEKNRRKEVWRAFVIT